MKHLMDLEVNLFNKRWELELIETTYAADQNTCALLLQDREPPREPFCKLTVYDPNASLQHGEYLIKTWSENEGIYMILVEKGILQPTGRYHACGMAVASICTLNVGGNK